MAELRTDPLTGVSTIVATARATRPDTHRPDSPPSGRVALPAHDAACPFCPGNESQTPPEVARRGPGRRDMPGWTIRVVPNLYPAVAPPGRAGDGLAAGAHEVVVVSPAHDRDLGRLDDTEVEEVFAVLRDRARTHLDDGRAYVSVFVNHGRPAGASIEHPHAQVLSLDAVPPEARAAQARVAAAGRDLVADQHVDAAARGLVVLDGPAVAWCPWAAAWPYEMVIAHPGGGARFDTAADTELSAVARATRDAVARLAALLGAVPYNVLVAGAGSTAPPEPHEHWYVRIVPRTVVRAGFEMLSGLAINTVAPEDAAARLRAAAR